MKHKKFKPFIDKLFWIISIPTSIFSIGLIMISVIFQPTMLLWTIPVALFVVYFLISPLCGYVELREYSIFIKYGFLLKKEIPYDKIRAVEKGRKFYSESMLALKNAMEHVNIQYNAFDVTTVSVVTNDKFIQELNCRCTNI